MMSPSPRTASQKEGPCGSAGSTRGPAQTYQPGATLTVEWDETVDHPGHYRVAFNLDGDAFPLPNTSADNFPSVLVDQIADRSGGGLYSQEVTLPDVECDNCTLQLMQIMTTVEPYNSFYFQCSDIILSSSAPGPDAGAGTDPGGDLNGGCSAAQSSKGSVLFVLLSLVLVAIRRRRSA
jgi:hypothetical protein